jgi:hypothetical protein
MTEFPLGFTTNQNLTNSFGGGSRPNYVPGCATQTTGSAVSKLKFRAEPSTGCSSAIPV